MKAIVPATTKDPEVVALQRIYYSWYRKHLNARVAADMIDALDELRRQKDGA